MTSGKKTPRSACLDRPTGPARAADLRARHAGRSALGVAWRVGAPFAAGLGGAISVVISVATSLAITGLGIALSATPGVAVGLAMMVAGASSSVHAAPAFTLDSVMSLLVQRRSGEAKFTEERTVSSLDAPLRASGLLTFSAPDRFARFTQLPRPESMEVDGNRVVLKRGGRSRTLLLDAVPELTLLAEALRGTLSGDGPALQRHFRVEVGGSASRWTLGLTPLDARLAGQVTRLEISGENADVRSIELRLVGGDKSVMKLEPLAAPLAAPPAAASSPIASRPAAE